MVGYIKSYDYVSINFVVGFVWGVSSQISLFCNYGIACHKKWSVKLFTQAYFYADYWKVKK
jgi:hypothetical protein